MSPVFCNTLEKNGINPYSESTWCMDNVDLVIVTRQGVCPVKVSFRPFKGKLANTEMKVAAGS